MEKKKGTPFATIAFAVLGALLLAGLAGNVFLAARAGRAERALRRAVNSHDQIAEMIQEIASQPVSDDPQDRQPLAEFRDLTQEISLAFSSKLGSAGWQFSRGGGQDRLTDDRKWRQHYWELNITPQREVPIPARSVIELVQALEQQYPFLCVFYVDLGLEGANLGSRNTTLRLGFYVRELPEESR